MAEEIAAKQGVKQHYNKGKRWGRPFLPGVSGNPAGRPPKELSLTSIAKAMLEADPVLMEQMVLKWLDQVKKGKTEARRDLQDRLEGRVPLPPLKLQGDKDQPLFPAILEIVIKGRDGNDNPT